MQLSSVSKPSLAQQSTSKEHLGVSHCFPDVFFLFLQAIERAWNGVRVSEDDRNFQNFLFKTKLPFRTKSSRRICLLGSFDFHKVKIVLLKPVDWQYGVTTSQVTKFPDNVSRLWPKELIGFGLLWISIRGFWHRTAEQRQECHTCVRIRIRDIHLPPWPNI